MNYIICSRASVKGEYSGKQGWSFFQFWIVISVCQSHTPVDSGTVSFETKVHSSQMHVNSPEVHYWSHSPHAWCLMSADTEIWRFILAVLRFYHLLVREDFFLLTVALEFADKYIEHYLEYNTFLLLSVCSVEWFIQQVEK